MSRYAHHLVGKTYGSLGTVLETPPSMSITGFAVNKKGDKHGLDRAVQRSVTSEERLDAVRDPILVLEQAAGRNYAFLTDRAFVVLKADTGELVTTYGVLDFDDNIKRLLGDAGY